MAAILAYRGPDGAGAWEDAAASLNGTGVFLERDRKEKARC